MATAEVLDHTTVDVGPILHRLAGLGVAPQLEGLDEALGVDAGELAEIVSMLAELELVTIWEACPAGPAIVLTPYGAARVGMALSADGEGWLPPRHRGVDVPKFKDRGPFIASQLGTDDDPLDLDNLPAMGAPAPVDEIAAVEAIVKEWKSAYASATEGKAPKARSSWNAEDRLPRPNTLMGTRETWPIAPDGEERCGACHNRKLKAGEYCCWCDRWGLDALLRRAKPAKVQRTAYRPDPTLKGGVG